MKKEIELKLKELVDEQNKLQKDRDDSIKTINRLKQQHHATANAKHCPTTPSHKDMMSSQHHQMPKSVS